MYRNFKLLKIPKSKTLKRVQGDIFRYLFVMLNSFQYLALQKVVAEGDLISPDKPNKLNKSKFKRFCFIVFPLRFPGGELLHNFLFLLCIRCMSSVHLGNDGLHEVRWHDIVV